MPSGKESILDVALRMCKGDEVQNISSIGQGRERALVILGSKSVGKTSLIHRFLDREELAKQTLALEYTFGRKAGRSLVKDVCHIWELGGGTLFTSLLSTPLLTMKKDLSQLTVVLMIDLSVPHQLWYTLETIVQNLLAILRKHVNNELEKLQKNALSRLGNDSPDKEYMDPFPLPLVIIGGKYDIFQNFDPEKKKIICHTLRYVAHTLGATLLFYSLREPGLVKKAKDVLNFHGFGSGQVKSISQDYNKPLLIPAGVDSLQQIGGLGTTSSVSKGAGAALGRWKHSFITLFPQDATDHSVMPEDPAKDPNFREDKIDKMRAQKDEELEHYRQEAEKQQHYYQDMEL